jgi:hypothetical protein
VDLCLDTPGSILFSLDELSAVLPLLNSSFLCRILGLVLIIVDGTTLIVKLVLLFLDFLPEG